MYVLFLVGGCLSPDDSSDSSDSGDSTDLTGYRLAPGEAWGFTNQDPAIPWMLTLTSEDVVTGDPATETVIVHYVGGDPSAELALITFVSTVENGGLAIVQLSVAGGAATSFEPPLTVIDSALQASPGDTVTTEATDSAGAAVRFTSAFIDRVPECPAPAVPAFATCVGFELAVRPATASASFVVGELWLWPSGPIRITISPWPTEWGLTTSTASVP